MVVQVDSTQKKQKTKQNAEKRTNPKSWFKKDIKYQRNVFYY